MIIWADQTALRQLKSEFEGSNDNLFLIKHKSVGSTQDKWYLIQANLYQSYLVAMKYYGVYQWWWYIRQHKDFPHHRTTECRFCMDIIDTKKENAWKNVSSETTKGKIFLTEVSKIFLVTRFHLPGRG